MPGPAQTGRPESRVSTGKHPSINASSTDPRNMCDVFNATTYCASGNGTGVAAAFAKGCPGARTVTSSQPGCMACSFDSDEQRMTFLQTYSDVVGGNAGVECAYTATTGAASAAPPSVRISPRPFSFAKIGTVLLAVVATSSLLGGAAASPLGTDELSEARLQRRADEKCTGFRISSQQASHMPSARVGSTGVCNGSASPCILSSTDKKTISADFLLDGGGRVQGIDVVAVFGPNYTDSQQVQAISGFKVPVNQAGYLTVSSLSTLFKGTFTGCRNGDQAGQANVPLANKHVSRIVITQG